MHRTPSKSKRRSHRPYISKNYNVVLESPAPGRGTEHHTFIIIMPSRSFFPLPRCRIWEPASDRRSRDVHLPADEPRMINQSNRSYEHSSRRIERREKPNSRSTTTSSNCKLVFYRLRSIDKENNECAICMRSFEIDGVVSLLRCGHYFCKECVVQWFEGMNATNCPLCRCDVIANKANGEREEDNNAYH